MGLIVLLGMLTVAAAEAAASAGVPCQACHAEVAERLGDTAHGGESPVPCTACHQNAEDHASAPPALHGMLTFSAGTGAASDRACLGCHQMETHPSDAHRRAGVACVDCHSVHPHEEPPAAGLDDLPEESQACRSCHQDVFARFAFNESHRLEAGGVGCTDCHAPHQPARTGHIGPGSDNCAECHAEKDGPFVFEHAVSRVEGCTACHEPHGSPNRFLLHHQNVAELCYSCHTVVPEFHFGFAPGGPPRFGLDNLCTSCHVAIHGSNLDPAFLR